MTIRFRQRCWLVLLVLLLAVFPAAAQDNTPQPEQKYILGWSQEILFPQAIRFGLVVSHPLTELAGVTLIVQPAGQASAVVAVPLDNSTVLKDTPFTELIYTWDIPLDLTPALFQDITLEWQVVTTTGERARITDTITFTDPRAAWRQYDDPLHGLNIVMPFSSAFPDPADGGGDTLLRLRETLQPVYGLLSSNTDQVPEFNVIVYNAGFPSGCVQGDDGQPVAIGTVTHFTVPCSETRAAAIFRASGLEVITAAASTAATRTALVEYLVGGFYTPLWGSTAIPDWFRRGLTHYYQPENKGTMLAPLQTASRSNNLFSLDAMVQPPAAGDDAALWDAQSYGMVLYIAAQNGVEGLYRLAREAANTASFAETYQAVTGDSLSMLLPGLRRWLFTSTGESAFTFTAYQPTTATPTATATATATYTATPSDTPTQTLTPTATGTLSPTPLPSNTPTIVPATATASVTPRPPGSLRTPSATPTPIPEAVSLDKPEAAIGLLAVGLAAVAFIIGGMIRMRRG
jgi:hypothetical protein